MGYKLMAVVVGIVLCAPAILSADQIEDLQDQVKTLTSEQQELRTEIDQLKAKLAAMSADAPTTMPTLATAKVNKRVGPWTVKITNTIAPNIPLLQSQLRTQQAGLPSLQATAERLRDKATSMAASKNIHYDETVHNNVMTNSYNSADVGQASSAAAQAENEAQKSKLKIAKLERELDTAENSWIAMGTLEDGSVIEIDGAGDVNKAIVQQMFPGQKYRVDGTSDLSTGRLVVTMTQAVAVALAP
jgi:outer membrane murein-binding lipoprotein Lpp